jgi:hypothetical protein
MTQITSRYIAANTYLKDFNKVKKVGFWATIKFMAGTTTIIGGHGFKVKII